MIPPNITNLSSDGEDDIIVPIVMVDPLPRGPPLSVVTVDQEPPRPRRRPSAFSGVFRSLNTIEESPTVLDGPIVQVCYISSGQPANQCHLFVVIGIGTS